MEYSITQLSKLSGVSGRTLRYYDEIGLLVDGDQNALYWYEDGQLILLKGDLTKEELQALQKELFYYENVTTHAEDGTVEEEWVLAPEE